jgi:hypothetical protein
VEPHEIQARAMIAAALITSHAVEVPAIPTSGDWSQQAAALRLRELTDYVYLMLTQLGSEDGADVVLAIRLLRSHDHETGRRYCRHADDVRGKGSMSS